MKITEYLLFAILLTPTVVVAMAAVVSLTAPEPEPRYNPPVALASSAGLYPADMTTDE